MVEEKKSMTTIDIDPVFWAKFDKVRAEKEYNLLKQGITDNRHQKIKVFNNLVEDYLNGKIHIELKDEATPEGCIRKSVIIEEKNMELLEKHRTLLRERLQANKAKNVKNRNIIIGLMKYYISEK